MVDFEGYKGFDVDSPLMKDIFGQIYDYAFQGQPIIMFGPSGSGKEYLARYYYEQYKKHSGSKGDFLSLNCAGLSKELAQSELFGHIKGAFTGADTDKVGLLEKAKHGVLFLDEIGDLDENVQTMLLRALGQSKREGRKLGDVKNFKITDTVIICATERSKDVLREAFLFRLGFQINVPGLDQRHQDIVSAVKYFLKRSLLKRRDYIKVLALILDEDESRVNKNSIKDSKMDLFADKLASHLAPLVKAREWPGNFRALRTAIDSGMIRAKKMSSVESFIEDVKDYFNIHVGDYSSKSLTLHSSASPSEVAVNSNEEHKWVDIINRFFPNINNLQKTKLISFFSEYEEGPISSGTLQTYLGDKDPRSSQMRLKKLAAEGVLLKHGTRKLEYRVNLRLLEAAEGLNLPLLLQLPEADEKPVLPEKTSEAVDLIENLHGLFISKDDKALRESFLVNLGNNLKATCNILFYSFRRGSVEELVNICTSHLVQSDQVGWYNRAQSNDFELIDRIVGISGYLNQILPAHKKTILILDGIDTLKTNEERKVIEKLLYYWYPIRFIFGADKQYSLDNPSSILDLMELTL